MDFEERKSLPTPYNLPTGDFYLYPVIATIVTAQITKRTVRIEWSDNKASEFHFLWLRDNCPCCVHPYTLEQTYEIANAQKTYGLLKL